MRTSTRRLSSGRYDFRETSRLSWEKSPTSYTPSRGFVRALLILVPLVILVKSIAS